MSKPVRDDREAQAARPWRILFVFYAIALTVGTHWPQLDLGVADMPAPDKVLHMLGFGGLALLLWRTRWLPLDHGVWPLAIIMLLWAVVDELTQAIPILGRTFSWLDIFGGWLGIMLVMAWIWALKPIGGPASRERHRSNERIIDELFLRPMTWALVVAAGLIGAAALGVPMAIYAHGIDHRAALGGFAAAGVPGGTLAAAAMLAMLWRTRRSELGVTPLPRSAWRPAIWHASATLIGGAALLTAAYLFVYETGLHMPWVMTLLDAPATPTRPRVPPDLRLVIDLTLLGLLLALTVRIARETVTRAVDAASKRR